MSDFSVKVSIAEAFEFLDESFGLRSRQILGEQDAVDEHPEYMEAAVKLGMSISGEGASASQESVVSENRFLKSLRERYL